MRSFRLVAVVAALVLARPASAQWHLGVLASDARFWGGAEQPVSTDPAEILDFRPSRSTLYGIEFGRRFEVAAVTVRVQFASTGLEGTGGSTSIVFEGENALWEFTPQLGVRVASFLDRGEVSARIGPVVSIWDPSGGDPTRTRLGALGTVEAGFGISTRFRAVVAADLGVSESIFSEEDFVEATPPTLKSLWRRQLTLGLRYRL